MYAQSLSHLVINLYLQIHFICTIFSQFNNQHYMIWRRYFITCMDLPSKDVNNSRLQHNKNLGQTTCFIINESVISIFNKLQTTRHANFTWIPKIILNIPLHYVFQDFYPDQQYPSILLKLFHFFKFHQFNLELSLDTNLIILRIVLSVLMDKHI